MGNIRGRIENLSPERQALLELLARSKGLNVGTGDSIPRRKPGNRIPLSFSQQRLWFLCQLSPGNPFYNEPLIVFRLSGKLNIDAFQKTIDEIVKRHESLRTTFPDIDGAPVQLIHPPATVPIQLVDMKNRSRAARDEELRRLALSEAQYSFDLARGPLLRLSLVRLTSEENVVLLSWHHIITDGWSNRVLMREVSILYEAFSHGAISPLPDLSIQYADFAVWQRDLLQGKLLEELLAYWRRQLSGPLPVLELPFDHPRPPVQSFKGAALQRSVPAAICDALKDLSRNEGVTLFMVLLAAFLVLLHRYSGQEDIVVGSPVANRNRKETEGLIGFFVNTLVLRASISGNPTFRQFVKQVKGQAVGAYAHQDMPFEKLVEALQPERDLSRQALFQVMFVFHNYPEEVADLKNIQAVNDDVIGPGDEHQIRNIEPELDVEAGEAKFDLAMAISDLGKQGLKTLIGYSKDLFEPASILRMLDRFETVLKTVAAQPDVPIRSFRISFDFAYDDPTAQHTESEFIKKLSGIKQRRRANLS